MFIIIVQVYINMFCFLNRIEFENEIRFEIQTNMPKCPKKQKRQKKGG